jgi:hypothetical protein
MLDGHSSALWYTQGIVMEHLLHGGDILGPFVDYTRVAGMKAFVSWRMSDSGLTRGVTMLKNSYRM